jgi:hypothetical protein
MSRPGCLDSYKQKKREFYRDRGDERDEEKRI